MHTQIECLKFVDSTKGRLVSKNHLRDDIPNNEVQLLTEVAQWCLPIVSLALPPSPTHNHSFEAKEN